MKGKLAIGLGLALALGGCSETPQSDKTQPQTCMKQPISEDGTIPGGTGEIAAPEKVDVMREATTIVPELERLVEFADINSDKYQQMRIKGIIPTSTESMLEDADLILASDDLVTQIWGELQSGGKSHNPLSESLSPEVKHKKVEGHNVLSEASHPKVTGSVVYGHNTLSEARGPIIRDSFIFGYNALSEASNVHVSNSVIFGWNAGDDIEGGLIEDSIIAGCSPLSRANVQIRNSYVITSEGTKYIAGEVFSR